MTSDIFLGYSDRLQTALSNFDWSPVEMLAEDLLSCLKERRQVFLCGNGGSAANAIHLANDLVYGVAKTSGAGMRASALSANTAVLTCLANDLGYEEIFAEQLAVQATNGDILIALSGSGNSPNIVAAIQRARTIGVKSYAVLGYSGGRCKDLAEMSIHFPVHDMQIAEDLQLIVGHMLMQWLYERRSRVSS